jgi:hypothetical protein
MGAFVDLVSFSRKAALARPAHQNSWLQIYAEWAHVNIAGASYQENLRLIQPNMRLSCL